MPLCFSPKLEVQRIEIRGMRWPRDWGCLTDNPTIELLEKELLGQSCAMRGGFNLAATSMLFLLPWILIHNADHTKSCNRFRFKELHEHFHPFASFWDVWWEFYWLTHSSQSAHLLWQNISLGSETSSSRSRSWMFLDPWRNFGWWTYSHIRCI